MIPFNADATGVEGELPAPGPHMLTNWARGQCAGEDPEQIPYGAEKVLTGRTDPQAYKVHNTLYSKVGYCISRSSGRVRGSAPPCAPGSCESWARICSTPTGTGATCRRSARPHSTRRTRIPHWLIANPCCGVQAMERRRRQVEPRKKLGQAQAPITGGEGFVNIQRVIWIAPCATHPGRVPA